MLLDDCAHASGVGKKFLEKSIGTVDPGFVVNAAQHTIGAVPGRGLPSFALV
jgi:hypothetical protein